jgi:hypothetical protein
MENLSIEKFNPLKAEVNALVENIKSTVISIPNDKTGYELMKENKKRLQVKRTEITKFLKSEREDAIAFQKNIIGFEKDLLALIEPLEKDLDSKIKAIDEEKAKLERIKLLPSRKEKLTEIGLEFDDQFLLGMDVDAFQEFYNQKKADYLAEKERKILADQAKLDAENLRIENEKNLAKAKEDAAKEALVQAGRDAELAAIKAENDKNAAVQAEIDRQAREEKVKADAKQAQLDKEKLDREALEKDKKYQKFLKDNGYTNDTEFLIQRSPNKVTLYKKIAELDI